MLREDDYVALTVQCQPDPDGAPVAGVQAHLCATLVHPATASKSIHQPLDRFFNARNPSVRWSRLARTSSLIRERFCPDDQLHLEIAFELDAPVAARGPPPRPVHP